MLCRTLVVSRIVIAVSLPQTAFEYTSLDQLWDAGVGLCHVLC